MVLVTIIVGLLILIMNYEKEIVSNLLSNSPQKPVVPQAQVGLRCRPGQDDLTRRVELLKDLHCCLDQVVR